MPFSVIEKIFASPACLNASFLLRDEHYACTSKHHGVDMNEARLIFNQLLESSDKVLDVYVSYGHELI